MIQPDLPAPLRRILLTRTAKPSLPAISCHASKVEASSNFFYRIFWSLSASESETTCKIVGLDKRKAQTIDRIGSTGSKTDQNIPIVIGHDWHKFAPPARAILLEKTALIG